MSQLSLIERRREAITAEISELKGRIGALEDEGEELEIAARVIARLEGAPTPASDERNVVAANKVGMDDRGKPEGAPTVPEMILWGLAQAKAKGLRGLEPKQVRPMIAEKWWPDISAETVNSIAWRMWKRGQLEKDGPVYMLPQKNEAAGAPSRDEPTASKAVEDDFGHVRHVETPSARP